MAERYKLPQGSIMGVHDDLSCTCNCAWSIWRGMPTLHPCWSDSVGRAEIREEADPALKEARLEEERAAKRRFFAHRASYGSTGSSEHVSTHPEMPQPTPPAVDAVDAPSAPSVNVQSFPSLPKITLRREDNICSSLYSGREVIVRWDQKGKYISCSCDLLSTSACKGGLPLHRCPTFKSSSSLGALVTQRATVQHNYAAMAGTFSGGKQEA